MLPLTTSPSTSARIYPKFILLHQSGSTALIFHRRDSNGLNDELMKFWDDVYQLDSPEAERKIGVESIAVHEDSLTTEVGEFIGPEFSLGPDLKPLRSPRMSEATYVSRLFFVSKNVVIWRYAAPTMMNRAGDYVLGDSALAVLRRLPLRLPR